MSTVLGVSTLRAAVYVRISKDRVGAGLGVARQEQDCRELAARLGASVLAVHVDNDISAYSGKPRPGYRALIASVRAAAVDVVLCWHTDRLHRSPAELEEWITASEIHGVVVHTVKAGTIDLATPSGRLFARQLGAHARYEIEHMIDKTKREKQQAAAAGGYRGSRRPYGYEADGVTVRPGEAAIVVEVTDRILAGESLHSVARDLNSRGEPTSTGATWKPPALRDVLLRARNAGVIEHNGKEVGAACWDPIVDPAAWRNVRRLLTAPGRGRGPRVVELKYLGSGLYECGVCNDGTTMLSAATRSKSTGNVQVPAYRCRNGSHLTRTASYLDAFITDLVVERLSRPDASGLLVPNGDRPGVDVGPLDARRKDANDQLDEIGRDAVKLGIPLVTVAAMTAEIESNIEDLDEQISALSTHSPLAGIAGADDVRAVWDAAPVGRRKAIVRELMTVTLVKATRGRPAGWTPGASYFDPRAVLTTWKVRN